MAKKLLIGVLFSLLILTGCNKEPEFEINENKNITVCGIDNPLENIPWLKTFVAEHTNAYSVTISVYKNNASDQNHIIIETHSTFIPDRSPSIIYTQSVYSCDGELLMMYGSEGQKPGGWDQFFLDNSLVALIWEVKRKE